MAARLILLHSPLLGPVAWRAVGELLGERALTPAWPRLSTLGADPYAALAGAMAATLEREGPAIVVAHSGAGALVPALAALCPSVRGAMFCDAILPHPGRSWFDTAPPGLEAKLRGGAEGGRLPSWDLWWPPGALERLVPDDGDRARLVEQLEPIPVSYFEAPAPDVELDVPCAYLQLSGAYEDEAWLARRQGWPVERLPLHHLAMVTHAQSVATAIEGLAERLEAIDG